MSMKQSMSKNMEILDHSILFIQQAQGNHMLLSSLIEGDFHRIINVII